ncbi:hypothetical protein [Lysobacter xanthus]
MTTFHRTLQALGIAAALGGALTGCRGEAPEPPPVQYRGTVLQVDGRAYARNATTAVRVPGRLQVRLLPHRRDAALARLKALGLSSEGDPAGVLQVVVPEGFEAQWHQALSTEPAFANIALADPDIARAIGPGARPAPPGPPPASVVERLEREEFEAIEAAGGTRLTLTATGASAIVHQQLANVRSDGCERLPPQFPDQYECSTTLKVRSCLGDCDPSLEEPLDDAKRIFIAWDNVRGEWVNR